MYLFPCFPLVYLYQRIVFLIRVNPLPVMTAELIAIHH